METREQKLQRLHHAAAEHLDEISSLFDRPDEVKCTLIVRCPWLDDGDTLVSNDDAEEAVKAIRHLASPAAAHVFPPVGDALEASLDTTGGAQ